MRILELIPQSRNEFIQEAAPSIYTNSQSQEHSRVKIFAADNYKIFGINRDDQENINYDALRHTISYLMGFQNTYPKFVQMIGDSQPFSPEGTQFAQQRLNDFVLNQYPDCIILFGFTGKYYKEKNITDTNHLLSLMVDNKKIESNRVLANMVDYHTPAAIKDKWPGIAISENVINYTLVYTNTDNPGATFGNDTPTTDGLTNTALLCCEGGVQSLLQIINMLNKNVEVTGVTGLRDLSDPNNRYAFDLESGKPYLSASGFLQFIKEKVSTRNDVTDIHIKEWMNNYFEKFSLTNPKAKDADTKQSLWKEALDKIFSFEIWKKLDHFQVIDKQAFELKQTVTNSSQEFNENILTEKIQMLNFKR